MQFCFKIAACYTVISLKPITHLGCLLKALNSIVYFCMQATNYLIVILEQLEEKILNDAS
jgi:hypothetical protein